MRTRKYKTLKGLVAQAQQLNFNELKCRRFVHKSGKYVVFDLPRDEFDKAFKLMAKALWKDDDHWDLLKYYGGRPYGIFNRLIIEKDMTAWYNAGQDQEKEKRVVRRILAKDRL